MNDTRTQFRRLAIDILDDENGISDKAYQSLQTLEATVAYDSCYDIFQAVNANEGRYYLPEDHGIKA